jgi:hypothetical protein
MIFRRTTPITALDLDSSDLPDAGASLKGAVTLKDAVTNPKVSAIGGDSWLIANANDSNLRFASITYDANDIIATANVTWPDGTSGVWTTTSATADGPTGATVTWVGSTTKTVTLAWTYDGSGRQTAETRTVS